MAACLLICVSGYFLAGPCSHHPSASPKRSLQALILSYKTSLGYWAWNQQQQSTVCILFLCTNGMEKLDLGPGRALCYRWSLKKKSSWYLVKWDKKQIKSIKAVLCLALGVGEQLGHSFSQSLTFCRVNTDRVQYITSHQSTFNNTSHDIHMIPPVQSPLKIEAQIKCWRKATHFSEPK